jgi:glycosyltransferase involved in cell wall biosynthesis
MKVALVHDWLTGLRGGEKCLLAFLDLYPNADIHALVHIPGTTDERIDRAVVGTSWLNRLPMRAKIYRLLLPFFPSAVNSLRLEGYDLIISLSHAAAKNIQVPSGAVHICYCFTPMRYIWDQAKNYFGFLTPLLWPLVAWLRRWDSAGAKRVDHFVAISRFIGARIRCFYGRGSTVIFPPVDVSWIEASENDKPGEAYLYAGALVPYKRPDLVVEAFNSLSLPLWVVGSGPMEEALRKMAGPTVRIFGRLDDAKLADKFRRSRALIFPGKEDFGMIPVECLAAGRPVIGLGAGGLAETLVGIDYHRLAEQGAVEPDLCGVFIPPSEAGNAEALKRAVLAFESNAPLFQASACKKRAQAFSVDRFRKSWLDFLSASGVAEKLGISNHKEEGSSGVGQC